MSNYDNSDLIAAHQQIRESQDRLLSIMNHSNAAVSLKDASGRYEFVNRRFTEIFSIEAGEIVGQTDLQVFGRQTGHMLRSRDLEVMGRHQAVETVDELELSGQTAWLDSVRFPIFDNAGAVRAICTQATEAFTPLIDQAAAGIGLWMRPARARASVSAM